MATFKRSQNVRYDKAFFLLSQALEEDDVGNQVPVVKERKVFGRELNVSSSEFYNAATVGLRPVKQLETYEINYRGEQKLKYKGITYSIIRTKINGDKLILVCERVAADG